MSPLHDLRPLRTAFGFVVLLGVAAFFGGCASQSPMLSVSGFNVPEKAGLDAATIVDSMQRAGLTESQIIRSGPAVRNALALQGGARVQHGPLTIAMFMVRRDDLYGVAINRGAFYIDLDEPVTEPTSLGADQLDQDAPDPLGDAVRTSKE